MEFGPSHGKRGNVLRRDLTKLLFYQHCFHFQFLRRKKRGEVEIRNQIECREIFRSEVHSLNLSRVKPNISQLIRKDTFGLTFLLSENSVVIHLQSSDIAQTPYAAHAKHVQYT